MNNKKEWTIMIYMAGDNNLSVDMSYALENLQKMIIQNGNEKINLFVRYNNNSPEIPPIYCDLTNFNKPNFLYSNKTANTHKKTNNLKSKSRAIIPIIDFVDWCVNKVEINESSCLEKGRKAKNYALIFSGHTMGFISAGLLKDESRSISMTLPDLTKGLEIICNEIIGSKFALLGFDSCVMSMLEVGQQFKNTAKTMIASEGSIPNAGWSYFEIFKCFNNKNIDDVAKDLVINYIQTQSKYSIGGVSVDMAAWKLSKLDKLSKVFEQFTLNLLECFEDQTSIIYKQMRRIILQVHFDCQTYLCDQNIDVGDFCSLLINELDSLKTEIAPETPGLISNLYNNCHKLIDEINNCILLSGFSGGNYQYSTGISLFFPWSISSYNVSRCDYENLDFVKHTNAGKNWNRFLQKYLGEINFRPSRQNNINSNAIIQNESSSINAYL